jgi:aminoglycoside/choline kinase family phosphotransferase
MSNLKKLFEDSTYGQLIDCKALTASGSNRRYFRLSGTNGVMIGVAGVSAEENAAFITMAQHFSEKKLNTPQLFAHTADRMYYLQQDLGDVSLFDFIAEGRKTGIFSEQEKEMLHRVIGLLPRFQILADKNFDYSACYPVSEFNRRSVFWDLNYFKYNFLKISGLEFQENLLENDFERFADVLLKARPVGFQYRDFQSRNVMLKNGEPYFIDFQGGRRGALHYDVASFLWQAKANFGDELREELLKTYFCELKKYIDFDETEFRRSLVNFTLFRILQTLGAYGFRGYFEKKAHFVQSIPQAIKNLEVLLQNADFEQFPYLTEILKKLVVLPQFVPVAEHKNLIVSIFSFSYKNGSIPDDASGNGGGFVFDCRAVHNPGRYAEYKTLTGLDAEVAQFLETESDMPEFLQSVYALVDAATENYLQRNFTNLMISFGCTGGQHRSVYAAEKTAKHLREKFGVAVELVHREIKFRQSLQN